MSRDRAASTGHRSLEIVGDTGAAATMSVTACASAFPKASRHLVMAYGGRWSLRWSRSRYAGHATSEGYNDLGPNPYAAEEIDDILIEHANAAIGSVGPDGFRSVRAVDGVFAAGQGQRTRTHRIAWRATRDDVRQIRVVALDFWRWRPGGLDVGPIDDRTSLPLPSGFAHPDGISDRHFAIEDKVQAPFPCLDHDGARQFAPIIPHGLGLKFKCPIGVRDRRVLQRLALIAG